MRKFVQLAEDVESDLKELDASADELQQRRLVNKEAARTVINDHHRIQDRVAEGIKAMGGVVEAAGMSNSRPRTLQEIEDEKKDDPVVVKSEGGSGDTSDSSFPEKKA